MIPHEFYDLIPPIGTVILGVIGLMIRNAIMGSEQRLSAALAIVSSELNSHISGDTEKHKALDYAIEQHDRRFDRIEMKNHNDQRR